MSEEGSVSPGGRLPPVASCELVSSAARDPLSFLLRLAREYGDVVQFPTAFGALYLVNHPDHIRAVLHGNAYFRVSMLKLGLGEGLLTSEGTYWRAQRRRAQPAFHQRCIEAFDGLITAATDELVSRWRQFSDFGQAFDVAGEMMRLTLQIIGKALFDADFAPQAATISRSITTMLEYLKQLSFFAPSNTITSAQHHLFKDAMRTIDEIVFGIIENRRKGEQREDLLGLLLEENGHQSPLGDRQVRDEIVTMFIAGHETTAIMLSWVWYLLADHPEVEQRLHRELDAALGGRVAGFPDLPKLPYTKMVIQEAMRLYPPVLLLYRKTLIDRKLGDFSIPANTTLALSPYTTHRDARFWEEADRFDPERFTSERHSKRPHYAYFPFGGGPHLCMGNALAMMEGTLILATIAQRYSLRLEPGQRVDPDPFITLRLRHGLRVTLETRRQ